METSAMGGDSHVWVKGKDINIGPRRVIPLCRAAVLYPDFLEQLSSNPIPSKMLLGINYQPTRFYLRTGYHVLETSKEENETRLKSLAISMMKLISNTAYLTVNRNQN